jgi:hypothetical protein
MRTVLALDPADRFPNLVTCQEALTQALGAAAEDERGARVSRVTPPARIPRFATVGAGLIFCAAGAIATRSSAPALVAPPPSSIPAACAESAPIPAPACPVEATKDESLAGNFSSVPLAPASHPAHPHGGAASYRDDPY